MIIRIEVSSKIPDTRALTFKKNLHSFGFKRIKNIYIVDVYTIDKFLKKNDLEKIASVLSNPITQSTLINKPTIPRQFTHALEIGFLPGVTDNVAATAKETIEDFLKIKFKLKEGVYSSQIIFLDGKLTKKDIAKIVDSLINPLIQRVAIKTKAQYKKDLGMDKIVPLVKLKEKLKVNKVNLNVSDQKLIALGKLGIENKDGTRQGPLALDLTYLKAIKNYFNKKKRQPTDIELESIAQTWSEHCKHTIFADPIDEIKDGLFKTFIKGATQKIRKTKKNYDICASVFTDNSGAIFFDKDYLITDKVETHNSPSALDPFGGAITGIVGVNRDTIGFGLAAKPIINRYGYCFAEPWDKTVLYKGDNPMLSARRIIDGVIKGVNVGGNCSGIPTPCGFLFFDKRYRGKPLVFVGTVGLIPRKIGRRLAHNKKAQPGDYIVMIGGRVGLDGIHGATFSSKALDRSSPTSAVQIGDPITQKKLSDAVVKEARQKNLYNSITDNGAGGLSCSVAEMACQAGGCLVNLEKVPLKYAGMSPWQIWISESQERMTLAVPVKSWPQLAKLMKTRGVEATIIGKFTKKTHCIVKYQGKTIMDVDMDFLHNGLPKRHLKTTYTKKIYQEPKIPLKKNLNLVLLKMLALPNIASFAFISTQYDHEVQGGSVIKPLAGRGMVNSDAQIVRPVLASKKGVIVSSSLYPEYSQIDTYHMAANAIDTAIKNAVCVGVNLDKLALLDNFCWCSSDEPERLGQLKRAAKACYDYATYFGTPFISGKDSMFNDFKGKDVYGQDIKISIPPTLLISSIGIIDDIKKAVSLELKFPGDLIYILGATFDELGASEYFQMYAERNKNNSIGNFVPKVFAPQSLKLYQALARAIKKELVASAISITRGGLAIALAKTAMAGNLGINISLKNLTGNFSRNDFALFSQSASRIIISINPKNRKNFEKIFHHLSFAQVGKVTRKKRIIIKDKNNKSIVDLDLKQALKAYRATFKDF